MSAFARKTMFPNSGVPRIYAKTPYDLKRGLSSISEVLTKSVSIFSDLVRQGQ